MWARIRFFRLFRSKGFRDGQAWRASGGTISNKPHSWLSVSNQYYYDWYKGFCAADMLV